MYHILFITLSYHRLFFAWLRLRSLGIFGAAHAMTVRNDLLLGWRKCTPHDVYDGAKAAHPADKDCEISVASSDRYASQVFLRNEIQRCCCFGSCLLYMRKCIPAPVKRTMKLACKIVAMLLAWCACTVQQASRSTDQRQGGRERCSHHDGCTRIACYGMAGSKKAEFCFKHATKGMINLTTKKCGHPGCNTGPRFGIAGTKEVKFCARHAKEGMINVTGKRCGHPECTTRANFGMAGSKEYDFCARHAKKGMINIVSKRCDHSECSTLASFGMAGSKKREFCSKHAKEGMINVTTKRCGSPGCKKGVSYGMAGSKTAEFCSQHAKAGMVNVHHAKK